MLTLLLLSPSFPANVAPLMAAATVTVSFGSAAVALDFSAEYFPSSLFQTPLLDSQELPLTMAGFEEDTAHGYIGPKRPSCCCPCPLLLAAPKKLAKLFVVGRCGEGLARKGLKYDNGGWLEIEDEEFVSFNNVKLDAAVAVEASAVAPTGRGWLCVPS